MHPPHPERAEREGAPAGAPLLSRHADQTLTQQLFARFAERIHQRLLRARQRGCLRCASARAAMA